MWMEERIQDDLCVVGKEVEGVELTERTNDGEMQKNASS